jgi:hypothetical protein
VADNRPAPAFARSQPFVRGDFGFDQDAVVAGRTLREFVSVTDPWGATLELQRRIPGGWETLQATTLAAAATGGAWVETPVVETTVATTYRYRLSRDGLEVLSQERVIRHVDPHDYTGLAGDVYALIRAIRPDTIIDVVHGPLNNPLNPNAVAQAHHGYDRIEVSDAFAEGGAARGDLKAVVLHELGHLLQWDAYGGDAVLMSDHLTAVFGPNLPLELSANCLCEYWGGLEPGNHYPCYEGEAVPCTAALAEGRPYYARSLGPPAG